MPSKYPNQISNSYKEENPLNVTSNKIELKYSETYTYYNLSITDEPGLTLRLRLSKDSVKIEATVGNLKRWFELIYEKIPSKKTKKIGQYYCEESKLIYYSHYIGSGSIAILDYPSIKNKNVTIGEGRKTITLRDNIIEVSVSEYYQKAIYNHPRVQALINYILAKFELEIPGITKYVKSHPILSELSNNDDIPENIMEIVTNIFTSTVIDPKCDLPSEKAKGASLIKNH